MIGTCVAETILASVHVLARQQAEHMDASDLIRALPKSLRGAGRPHMDEPGRLPHATPRKGARRVQPYGARLQSATGAQHPWHGKANGGRGGVKTP